MIAPLKEGLATTRGRLLAAAAVLLAVALLLTAVVTKQGDLPADAAFRYEDRVVTADELDDRLEVLEALYGVRRPEKGTKVEAFNRDAAKSMVVSLVLADEAAERDILISDKQAQTELDKLIDGQLTGGRDAFVEFLSTSGIAERDVLDEIRAQLATSRLVGEVTADVSPVTVDEAKASYEENVSAMVTPEAREIVNVVVESRADAVRVAKLAQGSGRLAPLAATWSLDGETRDEGGRLGLVTEAQLDTGYAKIAFAASKGEVFGPVESAYGWNVGQVLDVVTAKRLPFSEVQDDLVERLTAEKRLGAWRDFLAEALKGADVEYASSYEPADPDAPPSDIRPAGEPGPTDNATSTVPDE